MWRALERRLEGGRDLSGNRGHRRIQQCTTSGEVGRPDRSISTRTEQRSNDWMTNVMVELEDQAGAPVELLRTGGLKHGDRPSRQTVGAVKIVAVRGERMWLVGQDRDDGGDIAGPGAQIQAGHRRGL